MRKVLVVAVHPDDETLGCGGPLLKHHYAGDELYWLIVTTMNPGNSFTAETIKRREAEIKIVSQEYGFERVKRLDIPTMEVDRMPIKNLVDIMSAEFDRVEPETIYLPFRGDVHSDHRVVFDAAYSCLKTFRCSFAKKVLMMETISETEFSPGVNDLMFSPNFFVDISKFLQKKLEIMKLYSGELQAPPFPRSIKNIEALAMFRGAMTGCLYAESFMTLRELW